jgi:immune inhibitor A
MRGRTDAAKSRCPLRGIFLGAILLTVPIASPARPPVLPGGGDEVVSARMLQLREDREEALQLKLAGKVSKSDKIVKLGSGRYVETALERTERVFVVLVEYADLRHNQTPEPDRAVNAWDPWEANYDRSYYQEQIFGQMRRAQHTGEDFPMLGLGTAAMSCRSLLEGPDQGFIDVTYDQIRHGCPDLRSGSLDPLRDGTTW